MTTFTLELPDDLAARMESIPPDQRNHYAVAALRAQMEEDELLAQEAHLHETYPLNEDDKASLARAFADVEAGRVYDGDTVMAELFARVGLDYGEAKKG